jgi:hypothetical protein
MQINCRRDGRGGWVRLQPETSEQAVALESSAAQGILTNGRGPAAITELRALAERLGYPVRITEEHEAPAISPPRLVVVQRRDTVLAEQLRTIASPSIPVVWDRWDREPTTMLVPTTTWDVAFAERLVALPAWYGAAAVGAKHMLRTAYVRIGRLSYDQDSKQAQSQRVEVRAT